MSRQLSTRQELEQLGVYQPGKPIEEVKREFGLERIVKLASNENPFGYSPKAKEAIQLELNLVTLYPEATAPALAQKLATRLDVGANHILLGNGSDEIIRLITRSYIRRGDEVVMADITFPRYETNVIIDGGIPVKVPLRDGVHHLEAMLQAITDRTRMVFVCNPNNPTGTTVGKHALLQFIEAVPEHVLVIVDEAYVEYVTTDDYLETVPLLKRHANLLILRTFSKIYGLAALRIGYAIANPDIVQNLIKVKDAFNTNRLAQVAALAALDDDEFVASCRGRNQIGRVRLAAAFSDMSLRYYPSEANFLLVHVGRSGDDVFRGLLEQGIIVRSGKQCDAYPDTIRVTVGTEEENDLFLTALHRVLA